MSESLKRTPLYDFHVAAGARMVPFSGWEMPVQYSSILEEHKTVREKAGLFDVSHMGECIISGPEARVFIDFLVPNSVDKLKDYKALYTCMCYPDGGVVDDLIIYQRASDDYLLCLNAGNTIRDVEWITGQAVGFECNVKNSSDNWAQLAVQGPQARSLMAQMLGDEVLELKKFNFTELQYNGNRLIVSRTGYTGEDGIEIYMRPEIALAIAEDIRQLGIAPIGLGARDSLRLEAGFPLYGHEISGQIDPITAGLGWTVKLDKKINFIGKEALQEIKNNQKDAVIFFILKDKRIARQGSSIIDSDGEQCGSVLSGTQSPIIEAPIGSAIVSKEALLKGSLKVDIRKKQYDLHVTRPPLHKGSSK